MGPARVTRFAVCLALAGLAAPPLLAQPGPQASAPVAGAAEAVEAFHAALRRGDKAGALALLSDDVLVLEEGGAERSKAEYASHHLGADAAFSKAVPAQRLRSYGGGGGETAWLASESRVKGSFRGSEVDRVMAETMVLRRVGGAWKIVHIHWSSRASAVE